MSPAFRATAGFRSMKFMYALVQRNANVDNEFSTVYRLQHSVIRVDRATYVRLTHEIRYRRVVLCTSAVMIVLCVCMCKRVGVSV